ncbi:MAG: outer membrane protein assembly factor BamB, partial [Porticoccaceae bacterium]|nr:outer membrane protein assembly factor BamB [Porticoccaceae bacterium]
EDESGSIEEGGETADTIVVDDSEDEDEDAESLSDPKELEDYDESVRIRKLWRSSVGEGQEAFSASLQPAIFGQHIFSADPEGVVSAFTLNDGDRIWRTKLDTTLTAGVGAGEGLVLVGSRDGEVIALASDTGEERWRTALTSEVLAPPAAAGDLVVVQTQDGKIHGLSTSSGELIWRYVAELPVLTLRGTGSPVIADTMAVVGFASGKLVALNIASGGLLWESKLVTGEGKTELERMVDVNTPVLVGDIVYATSYQGKVGALSRGAGRELWTHSSSSYRAPSYRSGRLYVVDTEDKVYSYQASGGRQRWVNEDFMRRKLTEPLALESHLAVADREGYLHILATDDGRVVGRQKVDGDGISVAMIAGKVAGKIDKDSGQESDYKESFFVLDNSGDLTAYQLEIEDSE